MEEEMKRAIDELGEKLKGIEYNLEQINKSLQDISLCVDHRRPEYPVLRVFDFSRTP